MGVAATVGPSNYVAASAPAVAEPVSANAISEGVGGHNSNLDGATYQQDGGEPAAPAANGYRETIQEQRSSLLQLLLQ